MIGPGGASTPPVPDETSAKGPDMPERSKRGEQAAWITALLSMPTSNECVPWPFQKRPSGYGKVWHESKMRPATHAVLILSGQPQPDAPNNLALHACDNPPCVNPRHLRWGSQKENLSEMISRGRQPRGEQRSDFKVTDAEVKEIIELRQSGWTQQSIADRFGLSQPHVCNIIHGNRRFHATRQRMENQE